MAGPAPLQQDPQRRAVNLSVVSARVYARRCRRPSDSGQNLGHLLGLEPSGRARGRPSRPRGHGGSLLHWLLGGRQNRIHL